MFLIRNNLPAILVALLGSTLSSSLGQNVTNSGTLNIESETTEYSADIHIKREKHGSVSTEEESADKKRTELGIGETVKLTLTGKSFLIGDPSKIIWTIAEGENLVEFDLSTKKSTSISLIIKKYGISKGGNVKVEAIVQSGKKVSKELSVVVPSAIKTEHARKSYDRNDPKFNKRGIPAGTVDGDTVTAGASAYLELSIFPTNVSFSNIHMIELNKGQGTYPIPNPILATPHTPNPNPQSLGPKSRNFDKIGRILPSATLGKVKLPQSYYWDCDWKCHEGGFLIRNTQQHFKFEHIDSQNRYFNITVSKFDSSVSRTTAPNNKHSFN